MNHHETDVNRIRDAVAYDRSGDRIGNIGEVYLDDRTGEPMWVTVNTGFFGLRTSFVPLEGSRFEDDDRLVLAHDKDVIKDAPNLDEDGHLDRAQEDELYRYYGVGSGDVGDDQLRTRRWNDEGRDRSMFDRDDDGRGPVGEVLDGPDRTRDNWHDGAGLGPNDPEYRDHDGRSDRRDAGLGAAGAGAGVGAGGMGAAGLGPNDPGYHNDLGQDRRDGVLDDRRDESFGERRDDVFEDGDRGRFDDRRDDHREGGIFDRDGDGRGPIEEILDGPDDPNNPRRN